MRNYLLGGLSVICEFSDSGDILKEYVPGVCFVVSGSVYFYHFDRLGSVRFISDDAGQVVGEYVYDAFGNVLSFSGSISQPYQYIGREGYYREGELGLYLLGQRWYDEEVGRFISRDPIGEEEGVNLYVYVRNNPVKLIDQEGRQPQDPCRRWACQRGPNPTLCQDCCDVFCRPDIGGFTLCTEICYGLCDIANSPEDLRNRLREELRRRRGRR